MNRKVQDTIESYNMLKQGDIVIAAVSGGADSAALLHLLCALDMGITVRACHLNHCLRGEESERDERLVRTMCREYGVPLDVHRAAVTRIARRNHQSIELAAREIRYRFFGELAQHYGARVATAHTLSDSAETVFFHMARGTGLDGLCGIPPVREPYIRPLLTCSRQEIEQYCALHDISYTNDTTNESDAYTRNFIRHHVMPPFLQVNDGALQAVERMTQKIRCDVDFLNVQAAERREQYRLDSGIDAQALRKEHPAMRSRIILQMLRENAIEVSALRVAQAEDVLFGRQGALCIGQQMQLMLREGALVLCTQTSKAPRLFQEHVLQKEQLDGQHISLPDKRLLCFSLVSVSDYEIFKNNGHIDLNYALDYDKMENDIVVRSRKSGDRIRLAKRGCSKTLKKLYNELALSRRDCRCVLADRQGVLFAEGVGADERIAPENDSQKILMVKIMEEWEYDAGY